MEDQQPQSYGALNSSQMISEPPHPRHNYRMIVITIIVLLIALGGYFALTNPEIKARVQEALNLKEPQIEVNTSQETLQLFTSEIQNREVPWVEVVAPEQAGVGEEITVTIQAFSGGKDISGYDILLGLDPAQFELVGINSASADFQIQTFDRGMYHAITGYKNLQVQTPSIFDGTPLLSVTLKPKTSGAGLVTILGTKDQEKTQLIDADVNVIEPQVGSANVVIQ